VCCVVVVLFLMKKCFLLSVLMALFLVSYQNGRRGVG